MVAQKRDIDAAYRAEGNEKFVPILQHLLLLRLDCRPDLRDIGQMLNDDLGRTGGRAGRQRWQTARSSRVDQGLARGLDGSRLRWGNEGVLEEHGDIAEIFGGRSGVFLDGIERATAGRRLGFLKGVTGGRKREAAAVERVSGMCL